MEAAQKSRQPANDFFGAFSYPISMGGFHSGEELSIRERSFNACDDIFHASIPHIWVVDNRFADVARESLPVEIVSVANVVHIVQIAIASTADAVAKEGSASLRIPAPSNSPADRPLLAGVRRRSTIHPAPLRRLHELPGQV